MVAFLFPLFTGFLGVIFGYGRADIWDSMTGIFHEGYGYAAVTGFITLFIGLCVWLHNHNKRAEIIPTRFN
ncbi:MAG TPA: hypothetical protein DIW52_16595, partial [Pseudomonas sp.]|nr:hypothetical protein [Pseudomonas sp.]